MYSLEVQEEVVEQQGSTMYPPRLPPHSSAIAEGQIPDGADATTILNSLADLQTKYAQQHQVRHMIMPQHKSRTLLSPLKKQAVCQNFMFAGSFLIVCLVVAEPMNFGSQPLVFLQHLAPSLYHAASCSLC